MGGGGKATPTLRHAHTLATSSHDDVPEKALRRNMDKRHWLGVVVVVRKHPGTKKMKKQKKKLKNEALVPPNYILELGGGNSVTVEQ